MTKCSFDTYHGTGCQYDVLRAECDQLREHLATARGQIVQQGADAIALAEDATKWGCHAKAMLLDACKAAEAERDQLRADKTELLAALKPFSALPIWSDPYPHSLARWIQDNLAGASISMARALIAKHEAKP